MTLFNMWHIFADCIKMGQFKILTNFTVNILAFIWNTQTFNNVYR